MEIVKKKIENYRNGNFVDTFMSYLIRLFHARGLKFE